MSRIVRSGRAGAALVVGLAVGACGNGGAPTVHEVHADFRLYTSTAELAQSSDLVVTATARRVVAVRRVLPEGADLNALPAYKQAEAGFVVTDMEFSVGRTHKGTGGPTVVVTELGGSIGRSRYVDDEVPNSRPGQDMLLFLQKEADGKYTVVGGPQGRYLNVNGSARKIGSSPVPAPLEGKSVESPSLADSTPLTRPAGAEASEPVSGNGGKPAVPGPPTKR